MGNKEIIKIAVDKAVLRNFKYIAKGEGLSIDAMVERSFILTVGLYMMPLSVRTGVYEKVAEVTFKKKSKWWGKK